MDITQALKDAENALRDFIAVILQQKLGEEWIDQCGVSAERVEKWREREQVEAKRLEAGTVDERLIYYADFYDLRTILNKHWADFAPALGDKRTMDVWLSELEKLRDADAHRRELLPHQKHLALGISGEIRGRLVRYRSKQETPEDYFPRIESARDSLGNIWTPNVRTPSPRTVRSNQVLRPGDTLDYVIMARDPLDEELEYGMTRKGGIPDEWQDTGTFSIRIAEEDIGLDFRVVLFTRSMRVYHANRDFDDWVEFAYTVIPLRG
jgi:hypothetical protein